MNEVEKAFVKVVWDFYERQGRHQLPWRHTTDAYLILVSEVMLQQTQVDRVIPKYTAFVELFPTVQALAAASLSEVLVLWQGLGYNRRAKMLHECAKSVVAQYNGIFPSDEKLLLSLPGIGPYTARAVLAFAFSTALPLIETNVRTVYIHHFFPNETDVTDRELLPHISATIDMARPRDWYYAIMDYGSFLKRTVGNNITKSKHYKPQTPFAGSNRQIRGAIIRALTNGALTATALKKAAGNPVDIRFDAQLERLQHEGMVVRRRATYHLPD